MVSIQCVCIFSTSIKEGLQGIIKYLKVIICLNLKYVSVIWDSFSDKGYDPAFTFVTILPFPAFVSAKLVKSIFCIPAPSAKVGLECDVLI